MQGGRDVCLFADESQPLPEATAESARACMKRLNSLGLLLEVPIAGVFVTQQLRSKTSELPKAKYVRELLMSAAADEARHELGFRYAAAAYGIATGAEQIEAESLAEAWNAAAELTMPIAVVAAAEQQVFLITLALMRLVGGAEMATLAMRIAEDESRHVATNRALCRFLKASLPSPVQQLVYASLEFCLGDLQFTAAGQRIDLDLLCSQSDEILDTGRASILDDLTSAAAYSPPFETRNSLLYDRVSEDGAVTY